MQALLWGALAVSACDPIVSNRGHVRDESITEKVAVGTTTKEEVRDLFGSPSSVSTFGEESWYYIQMRKEALGFMRPEITSQDVTRLVFDSQGVLKAVEHYDGEDASEVAIVDDVTPTEGHSLGFFEQLFGNLGRFNKGYEADPNRVRR